MLGRREPVGAAGRRTRRGVGRRAGTERDGAHPAGVRLPAGVEAQVRPRSGQSFKQALTIPNAPGTIDADYAEEWMVIVRNDAPVTRRILHGERIAQVVFARYVGLALQEAAVERTTERAGGFGSTGHR